jgi:integrase
MTLGRYPTLSLSDARKLASQALRRVALGTDPASEKASEKIVVQPRVRTFGGTVDEYVEKYARPKNRDWQTTRDILVREYVSAWAERPLASLTQEDVMRVIDRVVARSSTATGHNRFVYVRHFFNWCVERGYLEASPIAKLKPPPKAKDRDRVLTDEELGRILVAADQMQYPYGPMIRLLILTAQRRNEVAGMCWSELDLRAGEWSLAADRTKSARKHVVPLARAALNIICNIPGVHDDLLFPGRGTDTVASGFSKWKAQLDAISGVTSWRVHDLRRTAATGMARLGVAPHVIERLLNHTRGTFGGVAGVYNRFAYLPEMRAALELWAAHVDALTEQSRIQVASSEATGP